MLKKLKLVSIFLCVLLLSTACTDKSKQSDADKSSSTVQENSTDTAIGSLKNNSTVLSHPTESSLHNQ